MKNRIKFVASLFATIACAICMLTPCEKHDGETYFKSKCTAELNGQTFIDQQLLIAAISPAFIMTPSFNYNDCKATFSTALSKERREYALYYVDIYLFPDSLEDLLGKELSFERKEIEYADGEPTAWEYAQYCEDNKIPYARIFSSERLDSDFAEKGTFRITSDEKDNYSGTFTLQFSEGTMTGEFQIIHKQ